MRPLREDEDVPLHAILSEPGVLRYFPSDTPPPLDRVARLIANQRQLWEDKGYGWWAVADRVSDRLMGWSGLGYLEETDEVEIKYLFGRSSWGRGIATETATIGIDYAFQQMNLETVIGLTHLENLASQRVLEKIGLTYRHDAEYFGMICRRYTITRAEYNTLPHHTA